MQKFQLTLDAEMEHLVDKKKGMKNKYSLLTVRKKNECGSRDCGMQHIYVYATSSVPLLKSLTYLVNIHPRQWCRSVVEQCFV